MEPGRTSGHQLNVNVMERLQIESDGFDFIRGLAEGFVRAFKSRTNNTEALRYVAVAEEVALRNVGLVVPAGLPCLSNGEIVLAETRLKAHGVRHQVKFNGWPAT
jgi:hypothetical protein